MNFYIFPEIWKQNFLNKYLRPRGRSIYSYLNFACAKQVRATATQGELLAPLENPHRLSVPAASRGVIVNKYISPPQGAEYLFPI